jgi:succinate dehydrogenase / fumarate reductase, cytochrome b subunit
MQQSNFYTSSIGRKVIMASTGILLMAFLVVHLGLNATIFAPDSSLRYGSALVAGTKGERGILFDRTAHFLHNNWGLRLLEILVFGGFSLHIWQGISLTLQNRSKRSTPYAVNSVSLNPSRSMGILGAVILAFLLLHLYQFWLPNFLGLTNESQSLYQLVEDTLSQWWVVVIYVLGCLAVAAHLFHGWRSAAVTFGLTNKTIHFFSIIGISLAIAVPFGLAAIPIALFTSSHAQL